jgi:hypothetical protein
MRPAALIAAVVVTAAAVALLAGRSWARQSTELTVCRQAPTSPRLFDATIARKPLEPFLRREHPRLVGARWLTRRLGQPKRVVWLSPLLARWRYGTTVYWIVSLAANRELYYIGGKSCAWA